VEQAIQVFGLGFAIALLPEVTLVANIITYT